MRLLQLRLHAFGPFTDCTLDFSGRSALHLIYGPNEAGKSSALRAMTDLRFGIPAQSPDKFIHPYDRLRIAGVFLDDAGRILGLVRRKGNRLTLSRFDPVTGAPSEPPDAGAELELALTGGLARTDFESMFGLNHQRLRDGGDRLLKGEGELGAALFEASAGTRDIKAVLARLEADAKDYYSPRAVNATINDARRQFDEQRHGWKQALIKPADWQSLKRTHDAACETLAGIDQALLTQRRRENELTELRTVAPLLSDHDRAAAELSALSQVPDLPERAREERLAAEQSLGRARQDLQGAELELRHCAGALAGLRIEAPVLEHAQAIERLAARVETAAQSRVETRREAARGAQIALELNARGEQIAPGQSPADLVKAAPAAADRITLDGHLEAIARLGERLAGLRERAVELGQSQQQEQGPPPPEAQTREAVALALRQAQGLGDLSRHGADLDQRIAALAAHLTQALADLGAGGVDALRHARPQLTTAIAQAREERTRLDQAESTLRQEDSRLIQDMDLQRRRQRELTAAGEVVTATTLRQAREHRNQAWGLIRQAYIERSADAAELGPAFDSDRALPEAFEAAQDQADRQADLLRADAARAATYEECVGRIADMDRRRGEIAAELAATVARRQDLLAGWSARLAQAQLPDLDPDALLEWQAARQSALDGADRLAQAQAERDQWRADLEGARAALVAALQTAGQGAQGTELPALIQRAELWDKGATKAEVQHESRLKAARQRQLESEKVAGLIGAAAADLDRHGVALQRWYDRLRLASDSPPEALKARLTELDALGRQCAELMDAQRHQAEHLALVDDFAAQAAGLAAVLAESAPGLPEDYADRLKQRLADARDQENQRRALTRDRARALETRQQAAAVQDAQAAILERLCSQAGATEVAQLPTIEEGAGRKRLMRATQQRLREQLALASPRPEAELRAVLNDQDGIAIDAERERCQGEIARLEQEQARARQAEVAARQALEAIDASDQAARAREAMECAAARYRGAIRPWARLKLAHALLAQALERFRSRAQAPMVALASTYFSLMTGGRFVRLTADESNDRVVLRAEREDGAALGVEALSEGTADQLYLALRLAALELRRASHPQLPLILDDVLVTSDDTRAAHCLRALAQFAAGGQVMLFTHHRHLIDLAQDTLGEQGLMVHTL
ncbi:YhaN family protein [uncultured Thiodictyon sp.]|uniref:ATP-binding protein n=1 Tax=uncultured Thiodictyon sp. TaxID=1846217 RepID=UPI0025D2106F|nr:YhaN family protein [uncultured Thiodictyon sp.]